MENFEERLSRLEEKIGYSFSDKTLLMTALTHSSYVKSDFKCTALIAHNERLEYLGDAVLELIISEKIYRNYPSMSEGDMTKTRAAVVCEAALILVAEKYSLADYIRLGHGEEATGGRKKPSILADSVEALIGALFLDGGIPAASDFISSFTDLDAAHKTAMTKDFKTRLQEVVQQRHLGHISYVMTKAQGPEHMRIFTMIVTINGQQLGEGQGRTKQDAAQVAAQMALDTILKS